MQGEKGDNHEPVEVTPRVPPNAEVFPSLDLGVLQRNW